MLSTLCKQQEKNWTDDFTHYVCISNDKRYKPRIGFSEFIANKNQDYVNAVSTDGILRILQFIVPLLKTFF